MNKLLLLFITLTLSVGLWAQETQKVSYIYPVYNINGDPISGIKQRLYDVVEATEITNTSTTLSAGWYVVKGTDIQTGTLVCSGAVHLILADGAKLTATGVQDDEPSVGTPGIQVSGNNSSLTIYAQSTGNQMGQLIAKGGYCCAGIGGGYDQSGFNITINGGEVTATGGVAGAGIGGGYGQSGFNITINGGEVTATGGNNGAGIGGGNQGSASNITINGGEVTSTGKIRAAGIGGGQNGSGSNITINGGEVTAASYDSRVAGIGGGDESSGSNIHVDINLILKADGNNPPTTQVDNDGTDLADKLAGKQYVTITIPLTTAKVNAIAEINAAVEGVTDEYILAIANKAKTNIESAETVKEVMSISNKALEDIALVNVKTTAIAEINAAVEGVTNEDILAIANQAKTNIESAETIKQVISIRNKALVDIDFALVKIAAIAEINAAVEGVTDEYILAIADKAIENINTTTTVEDVNSIKDKALAAIKDAILTKAKADAVEAIKATAISAKAEIDEASSYPAADAIKEQYKNEIDDAVANTQSAIAAATNVADVDAERAKCTLKIDGFVTEAKAAIAPIDALEKYREKVIGEIEKVEEQAIKEIEETGIDARIEEIREIVADAVNILNMATTKEQIDDAGNKILIILSLFHAGKEVGVDEGKAEALGDMGTEQTGNAIEVIKGQKKVILYGPDRVNFINVQTKK